METNWLGNTWALEINNKTLPSLDQIETGLITEAMEQLKLAMLKVKDC